MSQMKEKLLPAAEDPKRIEAPEGQRPGQTKPPGPSRRRVALIATALVIFLAALFLFGYLRHRHIQKVAAAEAEKEVRTLPSVNVVPVRRSPSTSDLLLPGNITPITEAYLYARASGYVRKRYVDIGDHVRQGQLLAEIEAPELDDQVAQGRAALAQSEQQLQQTRAQLDTSRSQLELARVTWERYQVLVQHGAISRQDADNQLTAFKSASSAVSASEANVSAAQQNVSANRANLERLIALQGFEKVRAPFDGIITARNFDVGALISGSGGTQTGSPTPMGGTQTSGAGGNAGTSGSASLVAPANSNGGSGGGGGELFRVAQSGTLRILINVPQENAPTIQVGQPATVFVEQFSKQPFHGRVTRTSNAIDPNTRTLLTEVQVSNPQHLLLPGIYAQVKLTNDRPNPPLLVPGDSIMTTANGIEVAIIKDNHVHIQKVEVGRDYGPEIEITQGLEGWEYVIVNPSDVVQEGAAVRPVTAPRQAETKQNQTGMTSESKGTSDKGGRDSSAKGGGKSK